MIPNDCIAFDESPAAQLAKTCKPRHYKTGSCNVKQVWCCGCRVRRGALGLSMADVAHAVGMSTTGYFAIEHGSDPQLTTAVKLATFYGVSVATLWGPLEKQGTSNGLKRKHLPASQRTGSDSARADSDADSANAAADSQAEGRAQ